VERARVIVHCVDAADPEDVAARLARVRDGVAPFRGKGAREIVVATRTDLAEAPVEADFSVDSESGEGIALLRERLLDTLGTGG
jgi:50S ribosomal subunit-associated GTPase HflX